MANLCNITGINSAVDLSTAVCVLRVATVGVGMVEVVGGRCWLGEYPHLVSSFGYHDFSFFVSDICFGSCRFLTLGLVLGWAGLGWFGCIWVCCGWFGFGAWMLDQVSLPILGMFSSSRWWRGKDRALCSRGCTWLPGMSCLFWMCDYLAWSSLSLSHLPSPQVVDTWSICGGNCILDTIYMPSANLASLSFQIFLGFCNVNLWCYLYSLLCAWG